MRISLPVRAAVVAAATALVLAPAAFPAVADGSTYTLPLHQPVPITAAGYNTGDCPGIDAAHDGWHFVIPGNTTHFVKLTVTFEPGGQQVLTTFGPPSDKHAYVASAPGAKLTAAVAEVSGGSESFFNLSHTCPATTGESKPPTPSSSATTSTPSASATPSPSASESGTGSPSPSVSVSATGPTGSTVSPSAGSTPSASVSASPSTAVAGVSASASASASPAAKSGAGKLASTGADIIGTVVAGLALVGLGAVLVLRRRKAAGQS